MKEERFYFNLAEEGDSAELLEILEETPLLANISLVYTRRPHAFFSLQKEGENVDIICCRDRYKNKIVGLGVSCKRKLWVNGEKKEVGYLCGLRVRKEYINKFPLHKGYDFLHTIALQRKIPFYITTILEDNLPARKMLEKKRKFMPNYDFWGEYRVFALKRRQRENIFFDINKKFMGIGFKPFKPGDEDRIFSFLNEEGRKYQFFPVLEKEDFIGGRFSKPGLGNFYYLEDKTGKILTVGYLWDQRDYKQYILQGFKGLYRLIPYLSPLISLLGYPTLGRIGEVLNFFTLSFWIVKDNHPLLLKFFLNSLSQTALEYEYFLIGIPPLNPIREAIIPTPHLAYSSRIYTVYWETPLNKKITAGEGEIQTERFPPPFQNRFVPYLECGDL